MSRSVPIPFFPLPPEDYSPDNLREIIRAFSVYAEQMNQPGPWRASELTLTRLQTDDSGLPTGGIFAVDGALRIVLPNRPYARGFASAGSVGAVTVVAT